jgi:cell pole-organizing protein PopZ
MEEILSSIRRIIADEDAHDDAADDEVAVAEARSEGDAESFAQEAQDDEEDVLELTRVVRESGEVVDLQAERSSLDPAIEEPEPAAEPAVAGYGADQRIALDGDEPRSGIDHAPQIEDEQVPSEKARNSELVSGAAATVATGAFAKLSQALQRTPEEASVADQSGRTVEQFIEDIARPMLKDWLDEYLPAIVERLVQKEIQKISRRAELN